MIKVKQMSLFEYIKHVIKTKKIYLGYTVESDSEIIELKLPVIGKWLRNRVMVHEIGHQHINKKNIDLPTRALTELHNKYDANTFYGWYQLQWKPTQKLEWDYTEEEFKLFK